MFFSLLIVLVTVFSTDAYVLLQVRKDNNHSNIDALIHKVVPADKVDKYVNKENSDVDTNARKSRYNERNRGDEDEELESVVLSIDTGSNANQNTGKEPLSIMKYVEKAILDYARNNRGPIYRSNDGNVIRPEIVHFRKGKPSVLLDIHSSTVIDAVKRVLSSKAIARSIGLLTSQAAVVYRTFKDEMRKADRDRDY